MRETPQMENFIRAFSSGGNGCRFECKCGRLFYDTGNDDWDWVPGELESLYEMSKAGKATALDYSVGTIILEGVEYAADCECWRDRALKIMAWLDANIRAVAQWINLEKDRRQFEASQAPFVVLDSGSVPGTRDFDWRGRVDG